MKINEFFLKRYQELQQQLKELEEKEASLRKGIANENRKYDDSTWRQWATSVQNLIKLSCGENSVHFKNFTFEYEQFLGWAYSIDGIKGVFLAAKADFEGGYLLPIETQISGEILSDFFVLAKKALEEGSKDVAAVLACAALEDSLKRFAMMKGLDVSNKNMPDVVNLLKQEGYVSGAKKKILDTMPSIRDWAMHANWEKITPEVVGSVLGFVEQFLLENF